MSFAEKPKTPMMQQYFSIKEKCPDALLFYRMGDFYELFYEDAEIAAKILDINLTKRGKNEGLDIAMCGVPHHASEFYLHKLIKSGHKVAICEQLETPQEAKKRGYKAIVKREIVRIVTPGTISEENLLENKFSNYLVSIVEVGSEVAIAWLDISTGEFASSITCKEELVSDVMKLEPKEIICSDILYQKYRQELLEFLPKISHQVASFFKFHRCENALKGFFKVLNLESFGDFKESEICSLGSLVEYLSLTQFNFMPILARPKSMSKISFMKIDRATRKNLELITNSCGENKNSLFSVIDKTLTSGGARLLKNHLINPLLDLEKINIRLNMVEFFLKNFSISEDIRAVFENFGDLERVASRLNMGKGGPRDLATISHILKNSEKLYGILQNPLANDNKILAKLRENLAGFNFLTNQIDEAIYTDAGLYAKDGNFVKLGYDLALDELRNLENNAKSLIENLREKYRAETNINNLKIDYNNMIGYFIEISVSNSKKISPDFVHRQTLLNNIRYVTPELKELENKILSAKENILTMELEIFNRLVQLVKDNSNDLYILARALANIDLFTSLAYLAQEKSLVKPELNHSRNIEIRNGRHLVVEEVLYKQGGEFFTPNDYIMAEKERIWLITGPNMAGKSTFLRQNALIIILAQIGCFVPASYAKIGLVDRIFSRIGAGDDLAKGHSTFMVEMIETATILNQATDKSFIILDEIGRGTSTYDGISIAWSSIEYLHNKIAARTMFATHYHELNNLRSELEGLEVYSMDVKEYQGSIVFTHKIVKNPSEKSYGIHVAELAGFPKEVIEKAYEVLAMLDAKK